MKNCIHETTNFVDKSIFERKPLKCEKGRNDIRDFKRNKADSSLKTILKEARLKSGRLAPIESGQSKL